MCGNLGLPGDSFRYIHMLKDWFCLFVCVCVCVNTPGSIVARFKARCFQLEGLLQDSVLVRSVGGKKISTSV